jgi:glycosyltransferase involved in cell wall biosynthesis
MSNVALAIAEYWRIPYVQTIDEFLHEDARLRLSRHWCRRLIATSREITRDLSTQLGVPQAWIATVNPGVETRGEPEPRSRERSVAVIGAAGPLVSASGFPTFLNAAKHVIDAGVDAEFVVAGQGEDEVDLRRRADRLKIADRVTFAGIPLVGLRFWDVLDLYCQPSLVPSVGRPLATALAFGVPSIASDIEGLRALVDHDRNGIRVPPGDSGALAKAILAMLDDPERAHALGKQGQTDIARDCHPDAEARGLVAVYREALDPDRVAPSLPALVD